MLNLYTIKLRHAQHYLEVIRTTDNLYEQGSDAIMQGLALFDLERINIEQGQKWASANAQNNDAAQLCNYFAGNEILVLRLHSREQIHWMEDALNAARQLKNRELEGNHLGNLGTAYKSLGETRKAVEFYEQALIIDREIGDRRGEGADLGNLGVVYKNLGETHKAIEYHKQALNVMRDIGDKRAEGSILGNLGTAYAILGETRKAIEYHEQHLKIAGEIGDRRGEGEALFNMSLALDQLGEREKAIKYAKATLKIFEAIEDPNAAKVRKQLDEWQVSADC